LERIETCYIRVKELFKKHNVKSRNKDETWAYFKFDEKTPKNDIDIFFKELSIVCEEFDLHVYDIYDFEDIIQTLNWYLNNL
jgi:hypothetical protein